MGQVMTIAGMIIAGTSAADVVTPSSNLNRQDCSIHCAHQGHCVSSSLVGATGGPWPAHRALTGRPVRPRHQDSIGAVATA